MEMAKKVLMKPQTKFGWMVIILVLFLLGFTRNNYNTIKAISTTRSRKSIPTSEIIKGSLVAIETNNTITTSSTAPLLTYSHPIGCRDIKKLEIIRYIGKGNQKAAFEVKLPSGEHAVAKRCISRYCYKRNLIKNEANLMKNLQDQYGRKETIHFFGYCEASDKNSMIRMEESGANLSDLALNFSIGFTSVVELGRPLATEMLWKRESATKNGRKYMCYTEKRKCFASHFTDADIAGLKTVAHQYANYSKSRLLLLAPRNINTDNCNVEQYMLTAAGMRHGDLDMTFAVKNYTYERALEINCSVLRDLTHDDNLNCSAVEHSAIPFPDYHINSTEAFNHCNNLN